MQLPSPRTGGDQGGHFTGEIVAMRLEIVITKTEAFIWAISVAARGVFAMLLHFFRKDRRNDFTETSIPN